MTIAVRTHHILAASLLVVLALVNASPAQPVVIDFEDLSPTGPGRPASVFVTDQYAARGVTFNRPVALDYSDGNFAIPGFAHSGTNAVEHCYSQEFCTTPVEMSFTSSQRRVKVWVGYSSRLSFRLTVILRAFRANGAVAAEASAVLDPRNSPTAVAIALEALSSTADIRRAHVTATSEFALTETSRIAVDDIEFDTQGPPPPCPATRTPNVTLESPANGLETRIRQFLLRGAISTQAPLQEATMTIIGAGQTSVLNLLGSVPENGGAIGPWWTGPLQPGTNTVIVRARNCFGTGEARRTITHNPIDPGTRFEFLGMEVTQSVQDLGNFVPLIAGKRTVARVYLRTTGGAAVVAGVRGRLRAEREDGSSPGGLTSILSGNVITVNDSGDITERRRDLDASLNFELPPEWIREGRLHFRLAGIEIETVPSTLICDGCDNSSFGRRRFVEFENAPPLRVVLWSVPYIVGGTTFTPRSVDFSMLRSWLRRAYPTARLLQSSPVRTLSSFRGVPDDDFDCDDVNRRLFRSRAFCVLFFCVDTVDRRTRYYGLVSDEAAFMRGCAKGIPSTVASGPAGDGTFGWDFDGSYADWYGGHELGHTFDRKHPGFCDGNSDDDDGFPYPGGRLSDVGLSEFGFDVGDPALGIPQQVMPPDEWTDIMTYCDFEWLSQYTYEGILDEMRDLERAALRAPDGAGGGPSEALMVLGELQLGTGQITLEAFSLHVGLELTPRPALGDYTIDFFDGQGRRLARYPFEPAVETDPPPGGPLVATIAEIVPWVPGTTRIVIARDGVAQATRNVSANSPSVRVLSPNGGGVLREPGVRVVWQGADADGDALTYSVLYSSDGGQRWHALRVGLESTEVLIDASELAGSARCLFRVIVSDGVNTAMDDSDAVFTVPSKNPVARIISPASGETFSRDQHLVLVGEATDLEDIDLDGAALTWSSDRDGVLGTGNHVSVTGLSAGTHVIALTAQDSSGARDEDTIRITLTEAPPVAVPGPDRVVVVGRTVELDGSASTGAGALGFRWTLLSRPRGSTAQISSARSAMARFVADREGTYAVQLSVTEGGLAGIAVVRITAGTALPFRRGDADISGRLDITDTIFLLGFLFVGDPPRIPCAQSADANDDGRVDIADTIYLLSFLFTGGPQPPAPGHLRCGLDPTPDRLTCEQYDLCDR